MLRGGCRRVRRAGYIERDHGQGRIASSAPGRLITRCTTITHVQTNITLIILLHYILNLLYICASKAPIKFTIVYYYSNFSDGVL